MRHRLQHPLIEHSNPQYGQVRRKAGEGMLRLPDLNLGERKSRRDVSHGFV